MEVTKPWIDDNKYKKDRLLEAKYEAELAKKFLEDGLYRNATGKAFQAWKALLASLSVDYIQEIPSLDFAKMDLEKLLKEIEKYLVGNL